jgi:hypothetical protein
MEKIFDNYKGVILFYVIIAILALLWSTRVSQLNKISQNNEINKSYYAMNK